jgi:tetratricopeptide (TPR) repeat protein
MASLLIENLEKMLAAGRDGAMLRFGLGNAYLGAQQPEKAAEHLRQAVALDPGYSAAWKLLGKALAESGRLPEAREAYRQGIAAAEKKGDIQAAKEMKVFAKRIDKQLAAQEMPGPPLADRDASGMEGQQ